MTTRALHELLRQVAPLAPELSISDVAERFLDAEHRSFLSLPVVDAAGMPLGLVSRNGLQDIFMQRFGRDLWGRRPASDVMNAQPLKVRADLSLEEASQQVTAQLSYPITEDFVLVD